MQSSPSSEPLSYPQSLTIFLLLLAMLSPIAAEAESLDVERIAWKDLHYRASKLFVTAEAQVSLEPQGEEVLLFLGSKVLGRTSETRLWVEGKTAKALREEKLKLHREAELRTYTYAADHALKRRFHARALDQGREPSSTWTEKSREKQDFALAGSTLPPSVTTPSALLYWLGASSLAKRGDVAEATIFADERLVTARAEVIAEEAFEREIEDLAGGIYKPKVALRVRLSGQDPSGAAVDLGLLGLEGDLEVVLDREKRLPLSIRGAMPVIGRLDVRLRAARLAD